MKERIKIASQGSYLVPDQEHLLFTASQGEQRLFFSYSPSEGTKEIPEERFLRAIGGAQFQKIQEQLKKPLYELSSTVGQDGERYFCFYQKGIIYGFNKDGVQTCEWEPELGQGHAIYDLKFQPPHFLWLAFPTGQTVTKVSLKTREEEFRIGEYTYEERYEPLSFPESLFITEGALYIPNMGNHRLYQLDLVTCQLQLIDTFQEPLWEYAQAGGAEYVRLDSGLYCLEGNSRGE